MNTSGYPLIPPGARQGDHTVNEYAKQCQWEVTGMLGWAVSTRAQLMFQHIMMSSWCLITELLTDLAAHPAIIYPVVEGTQFNVQGKQQKTNIRPVLQNPPTRLRGVTLWQSRPVSGTVLRVRSLRACGCVMSLFSRALFIVTKCKKRTHSRADVHSPSKQIHRHTNYACKGDIHTKLPRL